MREHEISHELKARCANLWNIHTSTKQDLQNVSDDAESNGENGLTAMREYVRNEWTRVDVLDYHMGNISTSSNGAIKWALRTCKSKISALNECILDQGQPLTEEALKRTYRDAKRILEANGKDELLFAYIENQYDFWNSLSDEELFDI